MTYVTVVTRALYGLYAWVVFALCALLALIATVLVPFAELRHRLAANASRLIFILGGVPAEVVGRENIPDGHAVVVANHASFVDGFLLKGYLPARFSFVIKGEMRNIPIAHFLLRRSGSNFVERHEASGSARDARKIVKAAQEGHRSLFLLRAPSTRSPACIDSDQALLSLRFMPLCPSCP